MEAAPNPVKLLETEAKAALEQRLTKQITADYGGQIDEKDLLDCVHSLRYAKTTTGETRVFCQDRLVSTRKNDPLPRQARDTYTRGAKIKLKGPVCFFPAASACTQARQSSSRLCSRTSTRIPGSASVRMERTRETRDAFGLKFAMLCRVASVPSLSWPKQFATIILIDRVCECFVINDY